LLPVMGDNPKPVVVMDSEFTMGVSSGTISRCLCTLQRSSQHHLN